MSNLLQAAGYFSRVLTDRIDIDRLLGFAIMTLGIPAGIALFGIVRTQADWR